MSSIFSTSSRPRHRTSKSSPAGIYTRPSASRSAPSLFGSSSHRSSHSPDAATRGFFSAFTSSSSKSHHHRSSTSSYGRRPRDGYIQYLYHKLRRLLSDLWRFFRRHPVKAFLTVIVPLLSAGGAVGALLKTMGVGAPLLAAMGISSSGSRRRGGGDGGYYGSSGYGGDMAGGGGGGDLWGNLGQVVKIAQAFV